MTVVILQPSYLPWLGFFEQLHRSDVFVIYDDVQYDRGGWRNRNRIKTAQGVQWLTVPVRVNFREHPLIHEVLIDNGKDWRRKHILSIKQNYSKAAYFREYIGMFEAGYSRVWEHLLELNMYFVEQCARCLGLGDKKIIRSSTLGIKGGRTEKLIAICETLKADLFYEGAAGMGYIDDRHFAAHGIKVEYQEYKHPEYEQLYGQFVPYLSIIDLLFNHGPESLDVLAGNKVIGKRT
jgi:hypothetical protein